MSTEVPENAQQPGQHPENNKNTENNERSEEGSQAPSQTELLAAKLKEQESKYAYLYADFENFKKRAIRERSDLLKFGWEGAARDLLQVVDNLERAIEHAPPSTDKSLAQGLQMILGQFKSILEKQGVSAIDTVGKAFDPNFEEAVTQEPSKDPAGTVTREHSRGYTLHGRLLRPARVVISAGPTET